MSDRIQVTLEDAGSVEFLRGKVRSGEFASEDEAVREMVAAWREEDAEYERWLKVEIARRHDEAIAHPERMIPSEERHVRPLRSAGRAGSPRIPTLQ